MRVTSVLLSRHYRPTNCFTDKEHEVIFKTRTPMKVGNSVAVSSVRSSGNHCIQEMFRMMACLKNNEFEQANCSKEMALFNECNGSRRPVEFRMISKKDLKKSRTQAQPGQTRMATAPLNEYLKKFPT